MKLPLDEWPFIMGCLRMDIPVYLYRNPQVENWLQATGIYTEKTDKIYRPLFILKPKKK